jgi:preprotein translocase subunit SecD
VKFVYLEFVVQPAFRRISFLALALVCVSLVSCSLKEPMFVRDASSTSKLSIKVCKFEPSEGFEKITLPESMPNDKREKTDILYVDRNPVLTHEDVLGTKAINWSLQGKKQWGVEIHLSKSGQEKFEQLTRTHPHDLLGIFIDDNFVTASSVLFYSKSRPGTISITSLGHDEDQAKALAKRLVGH